ncbi:MAG: hypothetical protein PUD59_03940 [bacterium]|nr:hypothetical protein [bacterium]
MNNNLKVLVLFLSLFLLCGCSVTGQYDVEIVDDNIYESLSIVNNNKSTWDQPISNDIGETDQEDIEIPTYRKSIDFYLKQKTNAIVGEENYENFYTNKIISDNNKLGLNYSYIFNSNNYGKSSIANSCYSQFNFLSNNDVYILSTNNEFLCFSYEGLENVTIHINTNHKVKQSNADNIEGNDYYWNINKSNSNNKSIYFEYYKDDYVFDSNKVVKITIIVLSIVGVIFIIILFLLKRKNNNNKI